MSDPVTCFFQHVATGEPERALEWVDPEAIFDAPGPADVPIYGRYRGHAGVQRFLHILATEFDTEIFAIERTQRIEEDVWARGRMRHRVRATGRLFACPWALHCRLRQERIVAYTMFEDTAALIAAYAR